MNNSAKPCNAEVFNTCQDCANYIITETERIVEKQAREDERRKVLDEVKELVEKDIAFWRGLTASKKESEEKKAFGVSVLNDLLSEIRYKLRKAKLGGGGTWMILPAQLFSVF